MRYLQSFSNAFSYSQFQLNSTTVSFSWIWLQSVSVEFDYSQFQLHSATVSFSWIRLQSLLAEYSRVSNKRLWSIKRVWWKSTIGHPSCSYLISVYSGFFENSLHVPNIATLRHQVQCAYSMLSNKRGVINKRGAWVIVQDPNNRGGTQSSWGWEFSPIIRKVIIDLTLLSTQLFPQNYIWINLQRFLLGSYKKAKFSTSKFKIVKYLRWILKILLNVGVSNKSMGAGKLEPKN